jgi:hypothetical protein
MLSRRHLLSLIALSSAAIPLATGIKLYSWFNVPAETPYQHFSAKEAEQIRLISGALYPGGKTLALDGEEAHLDRFLDELLSQLGEQEQLLIKFLLQGIEPLSFPAYGKSFSELSKRERQDFLQSWLHHDNHLVRSALLSIVTLLGMGYTTHPEAAPFLSSYHRCGFG